MTKLRHLFHQTRRGVTMTELLVVLTIVSLLATLAVPVYVNKSEESKISVAQAECREYANALIRCALDSNYFVPLQLLDDIAPSVAGSIGTRTDDLQNTVSNGGYGNIYVIDPSRSMISQTGGNQAVLGDNTTPNLWYYWNGPYINPQRYLNSEVDTPTNADLARDLPLDPWGQPYRFYTPLGIVGNNTHQQSAAATGFNGVITNTSRRFDRFAVVSFGPDQEEGNLGDSNEFGDDIYYLFSGAFNETAYRRLY